MGSPWTQERQLKSSFSETKPHLKQRPLQFRNRSGVKVIEIKVKAFFEERTEKQ
jgi:hypothetical protein